MTPSVVFALVLAAGTVAVLAVAIHPGRHEAPPVDWGRLCLDHYRPARIDCCPTHAAMAEQSHAAVADFLADKGVDVDDEAQRYAVVVGLLCARSMVAVAGPFAPSLIAQHLDALAHRVVVGDG